MLPVVLYATDLAGFREEYTELNNHTPLAVQPYLDKIGVTDIRHKSPTLETSTVLGRGY